MTDRKGDVPLEVLRLIGDFLGGLKQRSYAKLGVRLGQRILDVGCGAGRDVAAIARVVGAEGLSVGVEADLAKVTTSAPAVVSAHPRASIVAANAVHLPFRADAFDGCRAERLLQHVVESHAAVNEMLRVVKPGGIVVAIDTDWATLSFDAEDADVERRLARVRAEQSVHNGYVARQLFRIFREVSLEQIEVEVIPQQSSDVTFARLTTMLDDVEKRALESGAVQREELDRWHGWLARAEQTGNFFAMVNLVMVVGRKPAQIGR